jgi:tetratricopeptide (TPR) repeat protein/AraC-like DNA-binding protein
MQEPLSPDQIFIRKLTDIILVNLGNENFGVKELTRESGLSYYNLSQRLYAINSKTVSQFLREIRLQEALELLQKGTYSASEVAFKVGFGSPTYFNKCFHEYYGYPPGKVKKGDPNNYKRDLNNQVGTEKELKKSWWRTRIFSFPRVMLFVLVLIFAAIIIHRKYYRSGGSDNLVPAGGKISIAVMPFLNMTKDTIWDIWQDGIQERMISSLSDNVEMKLKIRQKESVDQLLKTEGYSGLADVSLSAERTIAKKLDADLYIYGSIRKAGSVISVDALLVGSRNNEVIKSFIKEGPFRQDQIFQVIDSLSKEVRDYLKMSEIIKENPLFQQHTVSTSFPEALRYYIYGKKAAVKKDIPTAIKWYKQALAVDSSYFDPMLALSDAYASQGQVEQDLEWVLKYYSLKDRWPLYQQLTASWAYAFSFAPPEEGITYLKQLQQLDDQVPRIHNILGYTYLGTGQYEKAIQEYEKCLELFRRWGRDYLKDNWAFPNLGYAYYKTGQFRKADRLFRKAEKYFIDNPNISDMQAMLALAESDSVRANRYIKKYIATKKKKSSSEADISAGLGWVYAEAGIPEKAEEFYRKAISLEPENPVLMKKFADFLIDNNRSLDEIPALMDKAMQSASCNYDYSEYSDTKGWGLYKQGRYLDALNVLQNTWDSAAFKMYFIKAHLEEVKSFLASQK